MLEVKDEEHLQETLDFAEKIGKREQLQKKLDWLKDFGGDPKNVNTVLGRDFSLHSFTFTIYKRDPTTGFLDKRWMNGGLLFHGQHDGHGSGAGPTFAVTVEPTDGWSIHT